MPSPYRQLNDPDWLRTQYLDRGRTAADIAPEVGCPQKTVDRALRLHDIRRPRHRTLAAVPADWLHEQYVARRRSIRGIASEVGLSPTSVRRALAEAGIPVDYGRLPPELYDPDWLATQDGVPAKDLARRLDVSAAAVKRARRRHGLATGTSRSSPYPQLGDRDWLEDRYHRRQMTQAQIAAEVGCSRPAVSQAMSRASLLGRRRCRSIPSSTIGTGLRCRSRQA